MTRRQLSYLILLAAIVPGVLLTAPGGRVAERGLALAVVVHKSCPVDTISEANLRRMLTGELRAWPDKQTVVLIEQGESSTVQTRMLRLLLQTTPAGYRAQLLALQFQGRELPLIKTLNSEGNAIKFVWNLPGAIAMVDAEAAVAAGAQIKVLRIDGKSPGDPGYLLQ